MEVIRQNIMGEVKKLFVFKSLLTTPSNFHLRFEFWVVHILTITLTDYGYSERVFFQKSQTFGLGQINSGVLGILFVLSEPILCTAVSSLSMLSINQIPKYLFGIGI